MMGILHVDYSGPRENMAVDVARRIDAMPELQGMEWLSNVKIEVKLKTGTIMPDKSDPYNMMRAIKILHERIDALNAEIDFLKGGI